MNNILDLDIFLINEKLKNKEITVTDIINECFERIEQNKDLNAFITLNKDEALKRAKELDTQEVDNILFGLPIAIKDNIVTDNLRTTCASLMLDNYIPNYDATVIEKIKKNNMVIIGKTNMDEFAMGSSSQTSYYKAPLNPIDKSKITGGSSGGSAACVGASITPFSLGSDTGGSIRQPASYTGIVGMKPTYGRVSRYGLVAFASSLDQIGPMTKTVYQNALLLNIIVGSDEKDLTSVEKETEDFTRLINKDISELKIAIPNYFMSDIVDKNIKDKILSFVEVLKAKNVTVDFIDIKHLEHSLVLYQIIAMGEASSNLARFDGVRYGYSNQNAKTHEELYYKTREKGFGEEVQRRIIIGSYILSGENAKIYYDKAMQIRKEMTNNFKETFKKYDLIIGPTTTTTAPFLGEGIDDPLKSFLDDVLVMPANMAGLPGINVPLGTNENNMPFGIHIIGNYFEEAKMYQLASFIEKYKEGENHGL